MSAKATPEIISLAHRVPADEQNAIADYAGVTTDHPAFLPYLGISRYLGLNPLLGEIWLIETEAFDRETGQWVPALRPAVGRDGFLKHAREHHPNFKTVRSAVVCANDFFETEDDGEQVKLTHKVSLTSSERQALADNPASPKLEAEIRGPILGAWAKCFYRDDTPPFYYFAPISEYGKRGASSQDGEEPAEDWLGAWTYTSALISKCSQSYVLRIGVGIAGVVPADEMRSGDIPRGGRTTSGRSRPAGPAADNEAIVRELEGVPDALKDRLVTALGRVNELSPFSWATAKVSMVLEGADEAAAEKVAAEVEREIEKLQSGEARA